MGTRLRCFLFLGAGLFPPVRTPPLYILRSTSLRSANYYVLVEVQNVL